MVIFSSHSKLYLSSLLRQDEREWNERLNEQMFTETDRDREKRGKPTSIAHLLNLMTSIREGRFDPTNLVKGHQVKFLSSLSNWHWWKCLQQNGKALSYIPFVNTFQHLSWNPSHEDRDAVTTHYATSVRNQVIFFIRETNNLSGCSGKLVKLVLAALGEEGYSEESASIPDHTYVMNDGNEINLSEPKPKRRRKCRPRFQPLTTEQHMSSHLIDRQQVMDSAAKFSTIFQRYVHSVTSKGTLSADPEEQEDCRRSKLWWRHHSSMKDVFILLDTDEFSGDALPTSYVHVEVEDDEDGRKSIICSCKTYQFHQVIYLNI